MSHTETAILPMDDRQDIPHEDQEGRVRIINMDENSMRRISAELRGDDAIEADMLETMLRLHETGRTKIERDSMLVQLAIKSLGRAIEQCRQSTGKRFPSVKDVAHFLSGESA